MSAHIRPCSKCPKRTPNGVCPIRAQYMVPNHPSCEYGRKAMHNAAAAEYMRRKHGFSKRTPKQIKEK